MVGRGPGRSEELPIDDVPALAAHAVGATTHRVEDDERGGYGEHGGYDDEYDEYDEYAEDEYAEDEYDDDEYDDDDPYGEHDGYDEPGVAGAAETDEDGTTGVAVASVPAHVAGMPLPAPHPDDALWDDEDTEDGGGYEAYDDGYGSDGYVEERAYEGADAPLGLPPPVLAPAADGAYGDDDDEWYDYDEEAEAYDGDLDESEQDWPPPAEAAPLVPVHAHAGAPSNIWAPGTAPGAWVPLGRPHFDNPLHALLLEPTQHRTRRRNLSVFSLAGLTNVLLLAYAAAAALLAAYTAALARQRSAFQLVESAGNARNLERSQQLVDATTLGVIGVFAVLTVANMVWCAVAARNHRMFADDPDAPPSPATAGLGWLVPLANLVLPYRTLIMLSAGPFRERDASRSVRVWWVCWLASSVTAAYTLATARSPGGERDASWLTLVALLVTALFLLCFSQAITVFRGVSRLQHDLAVERD